MKQKLEENSKSYDTDIAALTKKHESEIAELKHKLEETTEAYDTKIAALTKTHTSEIEDLKQQLATLNTKYITSVEANKEEIITISKEHERKLEEKAEENKQLSAYSFKLLDELNTTKSNYEKYKLKVKNLNFLDRILNRYPEEDTEEDDIKELNPMK